MTRVRRWKRIQFSFSSVVPFFFFFLRTYCVNLTSIALLENCVLADHVKSRGAMRDESLRRTLSLFVLKAIDLFRKLMSIVFGINGPRTDKDI